MSPLRLVLASLLHHWRMNLAVACGVAVGTAVLTGALLVGDSMRGSLRHLTLDRLGRIDEALVADHFFREQAAQEWLAAQAGATEGSHSSAAAAPVLLMQASLEKAESQPPVRVNQVNLVGCDRRFWQLGPGGPDQTPGRNEIVLNEPVARQLGAAVGDAVILRLPRPGAIPAESSLGQKRETVRSLRVRVSAIIAAEGLGRFGLRPSQRPARNAYVALAELQREIDEPGRANAILATEGSGTQAGTWHPQLADYGIHVARTPAGAINVTSDRMLLDPAAEKAIVEGLPGIDIQPTLTYLANTIACDGRGIPYSTITAMDFSASAPLGPFLSREGKPVPPLADNQIALNTWAADDLHAKPGDRIRVSYFEPESTHGQARERTVEFRLAAVVQLSGAADDASLTPTVRGITDQFSISNWDPPFPFDARRVRPKDDKYWRDHRGTPKAFVSLAAGRRLWASRFGQTTSLRIRPSASMTSETLERSLAIDPAAMGFVFQPVKQQGLAASAGSTPFGILFLSFSFFVIAAAVMLVVLLFRLGIDRRAKQAGILLAVGLRGRQVARLFACEGLLVAVLGSLLGTAGGIGYAALMLAGLRSWWLAAVSTPLLHLYVTPLSLAIGAASGLVIASVAIAASARRIGRIAPRRLLAGDVEAGRQWGGGKPGALARVRPLIDILLLAIAAAPAVMLLVVPLGEDVQAGAFFGAGAVALAALLTLAAMHLRAGATGAAVALGRGNLLRMALRNAARNPGRSTLSIGLAASACFLISAVSAFHIDPAQQAPNLRSGNGGFSLVAQSDQPIYHDLGSPEGRAQLDFLPEDERLLAECTVLAVRVKAGDDASCLNLYQARQPRMLGLPHKFLQRGGFAWTDAARAAENPWLGLASPVQQSAQGIAIPVVMDKNTANYSLHLWKGLGERYGMTDGRGQTVQLEVAGLLDNSIFQGDLLVSEDALLQYDPAVSGYRFFLIETPPGKTAEVGRVLERNLGDYGLSTETTGERMAEFLAVQNTYLSTFQSLGGLGLLLGTIGLAAVQLRNVLERRGELALLRAAGFRRAMLSWLVVLENLLLLVTGVAVGSLSALVAVLPHLMGGGASIPWTSLAVILGMVLVIGLVASLAPVRALARAPLLAALRDER